MTEYSAMVGGNTPPHLSLGEAEMSMLVNEPGGWGDCFLKASKCHERGVCVQPSQYHGSMQQDMRETLANLGFLQYERQTRASTFQDVREDYWHCRECVDILPAHSK